MARLGAVARPGARAAVSSTTSCTTTGTGTGTGATASWATTASTPSTWPAGGWASIIPMRVTAGGGKYRHDDDQETPDTHLVTYDFPGDKIDHLGRAKLVALRLRRVDRSASASTARRGRSSIDDNGYKHLRHEEQGDRRARRGSAASGEPHRQFPGLHRDRQAAQRRHREAATRARCCATWATSPTASTACSRTSEKDGHIVGDDAGHGALEPRVSAGLGAEGVSRGFRVQVRSIRYIPA